VWDDVREEVDLELAEMRRLFQEHESLLASAERGEPDGTQVLALAAILHSFYNGCENVFKRIAQEIDHSLPTGEAWHRDLLLAMARPGPDRPAVLPDDLVEALAGYLRFRHAFRHIYTHNLKWSNMAPLVATFRPTYDQLAATLNAFFESAQ